MDKLNFLERWYEIIGVCFIINNWNIKGADKKLNAENIQPPNSKDLFGNFIMHALGVMFENRKTLQESVSWKGNR